MIALSAALAGYESIVRFFDPAPVSRPWILVAAGLAGFAGNEFVASYRIRVGRRIGSAALVADGLHARVDGFTSLAVVAGAIGVLAGMPLADPVVGLVITVAILAILWSAGRDVLRRLMDGVDPMASRRAEEQLRSCEGVVDVEQTRLRWVGHALRVEARLVIDGRLSLVEAHAVGLRAEAALRSGLSRVGDVTIAVRPAADASPGIVDRGLS